MASYTTDSSLRVLWMAFVDQGESEAMKTLSDCRVLHCDKHQFRAKMTVVNGHNMNILALSLSHNVVWFCELPSDYQIIYSCSVIYLWLCYSYIRALNVLYNESTCLLCRELFWTRENLFTQVGVRSRDVWHHQGYPTNEDEIFTTFCKE